MPENGPYTRPENAELQPCPECGSTEREQKFRCVICADCRLVLDDQTQPTLAAVEQADGSFHVEDRLARLAERVRTRTEADDDR